MAKRARDAYSSIERECEQLFPLSDGVQRALAHLRLAMKGDELDASRELQVRFCISDADEGHMPAVAVCPISELPESVVPLFVKHFKKSGDAEVLLIDYPTDGSDTDGFLAPFAKAVRESGTLSALADDDLAYKLCADTDALRLISSRAPATAGPTPLRT